MKTVDKIKAHADLMELEAISFLDRWGRISAKKAAVKTVKLRFIDGKEFYCGVDEFEKHFLTYEFKLRPTVSDA